LKRNLETLATGAPLVRGGRTDGGIAAARPPVPLAGRPALEGALKNPSSGTSKTVPTLVVTVPVRISSANRRSPPWNSCKRKGGSAHEKQTKP